MNLEPKVLVLCPSRSRPQEAARMIESFHRTALISRLRLYLDMDDPCLNEYFNIAGKTPILIDFRRTITDIFNSHWMAAPANFRYFSCSNDDFIYRTEGWDLKLVERIKARKGIGIAYGNDGCAGSALPTTSIISREIVEILGWLQLPTLKHLYGDTVWKIIGEESGCLFYDQNVHIEHMHVFAKKAKNDAIYERTNSKEMYEHDESAFKHWLCNDRILDVKKVKSLLKA